MKRPRFTVREIVRAAMYGLLSAVRARKEIIERRSGSTIRQQAFVRALREMDLPIMTRIEGWMFYWKTTIGTYLSIWWMVIRSPISFIQFARQRLDLYYGHLSDLSDEIMESHDLRWLEDHRQSAEEMVKVFPDRDTPKVVLALAKKRMADVTSGIAAEAFAEAKAFIMDAKEKEASHE